MSENDKPAQDTPADTAASDDGNAADTGAAKKATKAVRKKPRKAAAKKAPAKSTGEAPAGKQKKAAATGSGTPGRSKPAALAAPPQAAPPEPPQPLIRVPMPVRWRDLDAFNHVNNSNYLSYLEEARLHWMMTVPGMGMDDHVAPVVAAAQLNYRRPITWPSQVLIELFVERLGNTSLTVGHQIVDAKDAGVMYCDGHVVMVWIDRDSGAAAALPEAVREACTA